MSEPVLYLERAESTDEGTFGRLRGEGLALHTAELPWKDNRPTLSCIPPGEYRCRRCVSPRFGPVYEVTDVPGRSHVLIHKGNWAGDREKHKRCDVEGCILLGLGLGVLDGQKAVTGSKTAVDKFMAALRDREFLLKITAL